jgi:hypothetical protein
MVIRYILPLALAGLAAACARTTIESDRTVDPGAATAASHMPADAAQARGGPGRSTMPHGHGEMGQAQGAAGQAQGGMGRGTMMRRGQGGMGQGQGMMGRMCPMRADSAGHGDMGGSCPMHTDSAGAMGAMCRMRSMGMDTSSTRTD